MSARFTEQAPTASKKRKTMTGAVLDARDSRSSRLVKLGARMEAARTEGLGSSLDAGNKGHRLLRMMGWDGDSGLGKDGCGIREPVDVIRAALGQQQQQQQQHRAGVGKAEEERRARVVRTKAVHAATAASQHGFQQRARDAWRKRRADARLKSARATCQSLDEQAGLARSLLWPPSVDPAAREAVCTTCAARAEYCTCGAQCAAAPPNRSGVAGWGEQGKDDDPEEDLVRVHGYLRETYFFCCFCGARYDDAADLAANCPGPSEEEHDS